jgi:hypothetical protein
MMAGTSSRWMVATRPFNVVAAYVGLLWEYPRDEGPRDLLREGPSGGASSRPTGGP